MRTRLVGIVNVTPDSFSDGGRHFSARDAVAAIGALAKAGAAVVDVGAESTRPGAQALSWAEEWQRLEPVFAALPKGRKVKLSLDSYHPQTVERALPHIDWINDVTGFSDGLMVRLAAESACRVVVMHALTVPADAAVVLPPDADVIAELLAFGRRRIEALRKAGIDTARIIFDPGVGFGKTAAQSLRIVQEVAAFKALGVALLVGHSRKSFLKELGADRDAATLQVSRQLMAAGVDYLRVHDVAAHVALLGAA